MSIKLGVQSRALKKLKRSSVMGGCHTNILLANLTPGRKTIQAICLTLCITFLIPGFSWPALTQASGAFSPSGGTRSESYNRGKALVTTTSNNGCKSCHKGYKRKLLKQLNSSIPDLITNCAAHSPCFAKDLSGDQLDAISTYFNQRYRLR